LTKARHLLKAPPPTAASAHAQKPDAKPAAVKQPDPKAAPAKPAVAPKKKEEPKKEAGDKPKAERVKKEYEMPGQTRETPIEVRMWAAWHGASCAWARVLFCIQDKCTHCCTMHGLSIWVCTPCAVTGVGPACLPVCRPVAAQADVQASRPNSETELEPEARAPAGPCSLRPRPTGSASSSPQLPLSLSLIPHACSCKAQPPKAACLAGRAWRPAGVGGTILVPPPPVPGKNVIALASAQTPEPGRQSPNP
jgi:hypothetical protein